jgi:hypothetical protein
VLAYLAFIPMAAIWAVLGFIALAVSGAGSMAAVLPMLAYIFTGWLWALLAIIALARAARTPQGAHAPAVALAALVLAVLGLFFLLPR